MTASGNAHGRAPLERFSTGVAGLDVILNGGLLPAGVYILRGPPGTGKTTLAGQICFRHIARGGKALFVTLLSEAHAKLLQNFSEFTFFSQSAVTREFQMISAFSVLDTEGLSGVVRLLSREVRRHEASVLAVDGLGTLDDTSSSHRDMRRFVHELQGYAQASGCVFLLLTANNLEMSGPENTMADGIIELSESTQVLRSERMVQVLKLRGSDFISGAHFYRITPDGLVVYPRTESLYRSPASAPRSELTAKLNSGIPGLDAMTGGLPRASTTLVLGASGSGKTTFGLQFLNASSADEPGLFFGFHETPETNFAKAASLGWNINRLVAEGSLEFLWEPPYGGLVDTITRHIIENVSRRGVRRLFVDGLGGFEQTAFLQERVGAATAAMMNALRAQGVTCVFSWEMPDLLGAELRSPRRYLSALIDNFILLRYAEIDSVLHRRISTLKMRSSEFDPTVRSFTIGHGGILIGQPDSAHGMPAPLLPEARPPPSDSDGGP